MEEIVTIVDKENNVTGHAPRSQMRSQGLIHRASYIYVFNSDRKLFVHKRVKTKDVFPGYYDLCAGGVILKDESYEVGAVRELEEEFGIANVPLNEHFVFYYKDDQIKVWGKVFTCTYDGEMVLQKEEIESGSFMKCEDVIKLSESQPITPDTLQVFKRLINDPGQC